MVASPTRFDELPTLAFAAPKRILPLPTPPRLRPLAPSIALAPPARSSSRPSITPVGLPVVVPRALRKAKLIIELQVDELDAQEVVQITTWLAGRGSSVVVRRGVLARTADALWEKVLELGRTARTLRHVARGALASALARVKAAAARM